MNKCCYFALRNIQYLYMYDNRTTCSMQAVKHQYNSQCHIPYLSDPSKLIKFTSNNSITHIFLPPQLLVISTNDSFYSLRYDPFFRFKHFFMNIKIVKLVTHIIFFRVIRFITSSLTISKMLLFGRLFSFILLPKVNRVRQSTY